MEQLWCQLTDIGGFEGFVGRVGREPLLDQGTLEIVFPVERALPLSSKTDIHHFEAKSNSFGIKLDTPRNVPSYIHINC